jgi:hypothetical protein
MDIMAMIVFVVLLLLLLPPPPAFSHLPSSIDFFRRFPRTVLPVKDLAMNSSRAPAL